jgi:predicted small secreted protein
MKRLIALLMIAGAAMTALAGCNTVAGAGQDVTAAGHAVTNSADKNKPN